MSGIIINVRTVGRKCATFKYVTGPFALGRSFSGTTGSKDTTGVGTPRPPEMPNMPDMATLMKDPAMMAAAKEMMANPAMMAAAMKVMEDPSMQKSISGMASGAQTPGGAMPDMAILNKFLAELEQIEKSKPASK